MADTARPGTMNEASVAGLTLFPLLPGMTRGTVPFKQWTQMADGRPGLSLIPIGGEVGDSTADSQGDPEIKVIAAHEGTSDVAESASPVDWFDDLHILPRAKIEFGNIITQKEEEFEIYNAYRSESVTISSITDNVSPGIEVPEITAPTVIGPQASVLDPTSLANSGSLLSVYGTPGANQQDGLVKTKIQALTDGLPVFDGTITFTSAASSEQVSVDVTGSRIVLFPFEYEAPMSEMMGFLTDIIEALSGKEQRIALRENPRQIFDVKYLLSDNERQRAQVLLMEWTDNAFGFPLWMEQERLTVAASIGTTVYQIQDTSGMDLRVGGLALVLTDNNTFDVITIEELTSTTITAVDPSLNAYAIGTKIMPLRTAQLVRTVRGRRHANNLEELLCSFEVTDNSTGSLTGDTTPGVWSLHTDGRVLFDDCNVMRSQSVGEEYKRRIHRIDNATGLVTQSSTWDRGKRGHVKGFAMHSRAEIIKFRQLMQSIQGKVVSFWIPTFIDDLEVMEDLASGSAVMDINLIRYARFVANRMPKNLFRITFTDDTSLVRQIDASADHPTDSTMERLTLDATWPAARTVDEISRIEFYELVRFDTDQFKLKYPRIGLATMIAPVIQVFDDNA